MRCRDLGSRNANADADADADAAERQALHELFSRGIATPSEPFRLPLLVSCCAFVSAPPKTLLIEFVSAERAVAVENRALPVRRSGLRVDSGIPALGFYGAPAKKGAQRRTPPLPTG